MGLHDVVPILINFEYKFKCVVFHSGSPQDIKIRQTMYINIKGMEGSGNFSILGTLGRVSEAGEANSNNVKCFLKIIV